ncbi:MAG: hypothetical protein ABSE82_07215 [Nitrososphaerales archaeon]|jgi:predicted transcriptional regulator
MTTMLILGKAKSVLVKAMADNYSSKIIFSIISEPLTIEEICHEQHIPVSTCYRKIRYLESNGIVRKFDTSISKEGRKFVRYISILKNATVNFGSMRFDVDVESNKVPLEAISPLVLR